MHTPETHDTYSFKETEIRMVLGTEMMEARRQFYDFFKVLEENNL